ncbi:MAG: hypothetical protein Q8S10_11590 [Thiobacillus sp.]|nr:hypothetical protein [Thiobacillus sp.]
MRIRSLLTLLAIVPAFLMLPAAADSTPGSTPAATQQKTISAEACIAQAQGKGMHLAQIQTACCKAHKGICGCRAGKIVCCDNSTSNDPACTCHGDEGVVE